MNIMPPFIAYGTVLGIHYVTAMGIESILIPKFDPDQFDQLLLKYKPSCVMGVPTHFDSVISSRKLKNIDLSFLKVAFVGGDKIKEETENRINAFLKDHNCNIYISKGYSLTEASATATFATKESNKEGSAGIPLTKTIVSAFGTSVNEELTYNEKGILYISSPTIMMGYYKNPEETNKVIVEDKNGRKWLYTGDQGYIDEDGCVFVLGREKRIIIRHDGFKVFPYAVENAVQSVKCVKNCCAVSVPDKAHSQGQTPVVYVVLNNGDNEDKESVITDINEACKQLLPEYAQPTKVIIIDELPVTSIGKVDYRALENANISHTENDRKVLR